MFRFATFLVLGTVIAAVAVFAVIGRGDENIRKETSPPDTRDFTVLPTGVSFTSPDNTGQENSSDPGADASQEFSSLDRMQFLAAAASEFTTLLGETKAYPLRIWFFEDRGVYVEYARSSEATMASHMVFMRQTQAGDFTVVTRYEFGESDWRVAEGEDTRFAFPQEDLYERNSAGNWAKVN